MLMDIINKPHQGLNGPVDPVQGTVTLNDSRSAANASDFSKAEMSARRLRRQRRMERSRQYSIGGWKVRAW